MFFIRKKESENVIFASGDLLRGSKVQKRQFVKRKDF